MTSGIGLRLAILLAGTVLALVPEHLYLVPLLVTVLGALLAAAIPERVGAAVLLGGFLVGWVVATGWHETPSVWRTVVAAAAVYVAHLATALATFVPAGARVQRGAVLRCVRRSLLPAGVGAVVVTVDLALPRAFGSAVFEAAGAVALVVLAVGAVLLTRES